MLSVVFVSTVSDMAGQAKCLAGEKCQRYHGKSSKCSPTSIMHHKLGSNLLVTFQYQKVKFLS